MRIRKATWNDLKEIMPIYTRARAYMAENNNPNQWGDGYPFEAHIREDIERGTFYVIEKDRICGVFSLIFGEDPTYNVIEDGAWKNDAPYATIHRLASAGICPGIAKTCFNWCKQQSDNLRIDTHHDNHVMQHVILQAGFEKCGQIYVRDGTKRMAYQWIKP